MNFKYCLLLLLLLVSCKHRPESDKLAVEAEIAKAHSDYFKSRNSVFFDFDSHKIRGEGRSRVEKMIRELSTVPNANIVLYGYTDRVGSVKYNYNLAMKRAKAVKSMLVASGIIQAQNIKIIIKDYGKFDPMVSHETIANNPQSRRVDMYLISTKNHNE